LRGLIANSPKPATLIPHGNSNLLAYSADGKLLATAGSEYGGADFHIWSTSSGKLICTIDRSNHSIKSLTFSPDAKYIVTTDGSTISLWDVASGQHWRDVAYHTRGMNSQIIVPNPTSCEFMPDGKTIAASMASIDFGGIVLFDLADILDDQLQKAATQLLKHQAYIERGPIYKIKMQVHGRDSADSLELVRQMGRPVSLNLSESQNLVDPFLARLARADNLLELDLSRAPQLSDAGLVHLRELPKLERLNLANTKVTDIGLRHLHVLPKLNAIHLKKTAVTDAGRKALKDAIPSIEFIDE
jgi:hypothetical protein